MDIGMGMQLLISLIFHDFPFYIAPLLCRAKSRDFHYKRAMQE